VARAEAAWRVREGQDGAPYAGPVPDGVAERWDTAAWTPVARSKRFAHLDGGIRDDPTFATVAALEDFDEATQTARKTPLFTVDVLTARPDRDTAATPAEAVAISMDETGQVDLDRVGSLLGVDADTAGTAVAGVVFTDPGQPGGSALVPAARYLSGNVRSKLAAAEAAAAATDPGFTVNVTALRQVMPRTIEAAEIAVRPGVPWIPTTDYEAFVRDVLGASTVSVDFTQGTWTVQVPSWQRNSPLMTDVFGTDDYDAAKLLEAVANSRPIQVLRPPRVVADTGADPVDPTKTFAAQAQARKLTERFAEWVFTDDTRRDRLVTEYNVRFNSLRPARYDGADLALPGQTNATRWPASSTNPPCCSTTSSGRARPGSCSWGRWSCAAWAWPANPGSWSPTTSSSRSGAKPSSGTRRPTSSSPPTPTTRSAAAGSPPRPPPRTGTWSSSPSPCSPRSGCPRNAGPNTCNAKPTRCKRRIGSRPIPSAPRRSRTRSPRRRSVCGR